MNRKPRLWFDPKRGRFVICSSEVSDSGGIRRLRTSTHTDNRAEAEWFFSNWSRNRAESVPQKTGKLYSVFVGMRRAQAILDVATKTPGITPGRIAQRLSRSSALFPESPSYLKKYITFLLKDAGITEYPYRRRGEVGGRRISRTEAEGRTGVIVDMLLRGKSRLEILDFCFENYGISSRTAETYIARATGAASEVRWRAMSESAKILTTPGKE